MSETAHDPIRIDHAPAVLSSVLAIVALLVAVVVIAFSSFLLAIPIGVIALILFGLGFITGYRVTIGLGTALLFFGMIVMGTFADASAAILLIGVIATILAWDFGENAINIGEQLTRNAESVRSQSVHAASTAVIGTLGGGIAYGIYRLSAGGKPLPALILMLLGVALAGWLIRK